MYTEIKACRICKNKNLAPILHLGTQSLTGVFPKSKKQKVTAGPVELLKCVEDKDGKHCGLLQMKQSYDLKEMYGLNYGYRSGLNSSMVAHLRNKIADILKLVTPQRGDIVIDIGSNDSTLLQSYPNNGAIFCGIDPTGVKFKAYYPSHIQLIPDFFSAEAFKKKFGKDAKARIVTSIAMFYDIEDPLAFMNQIAAILHPEGVWVFEQSYMPTMLDENAYDTICHEHLEYYRLKQIKWLADRAGLKIIDVQFNRINGGSFSVMAAPKASSLKENTRLIKKILKDEEKKGLHTLKPYQAFAKRVFKHAKELRATLAKISAEGKTVLGYGASTKGNVILQLCQLTEKDLVAIAEVNQEKFGCFTPGTLIPIISEVQAKVMKPDYFLVFPWHFRSNLVEREQEYLESGGRMIFPLPKIEVVKK